MGPSWPFLSGQAWAEHPVFHRIKSHRFAEIDLDGWDPSSFRKGSEESELPEKRWGRGSIDNINNIRNVNMNVNNKSINTTSNSNNISNNNNSNNNMKFNININDNNVNNNNIKSISSSININNYNNSCSNTNGNISNINLPVISVNQDVFNLMRWG